MKQRAPNFSGALLRREVDWLLAAFTLAGMAGAVAVAQHISVAQLGGDVVSRLLRRFDMTVLYLLAFLLIVRTAIRVDADQIAAWPRSVVASGASRASYGLLVAGAATLSAAAVFVATAVSFGFAVRIFDGTSELVRSLPAALAGGLLLLAAYGVYAAILSVLLRQALPALLTALVLLMLPYAVMMQYLRAGTLPPKWMHYWIRSYPPLVLPSDAGTFVGAAVYVLIGMVVLAMASHRYAGRHS